MVVMIPSLLLTGRFGAIASVARVSMTLSVVMFPNLKDVIGNGIFIFDNMSQVQAARRSKKKGTVGMNIPASLPISFAQSEIL